MTWPQDFWVGGCPEYVAQVLAVKTFDTSVTVVPVDLETLEVGCNYTITTMIETRGFTMGLLVWRGYVILCNVDPGIPLSDYPAYAEAALAILNQFLEG